MNDVFHELLNDFVVVYLDDSIVYITFAEHLEHLRRVFGRLWFHSLYVKWEKCEFHLKEIGFLGYVIS